MSGQDHYHRTPGHVVRDLAEKLEERAALHKKLSKLSDEIDDLCDRLAPLVTERRTLAVFRGGYSVSLIDIHPDGLDGVTCALVRTFDADAWVWPEPEAKAEQAAQLKLPDVWLAAGPAVDGNIQSVRPAGATELLAVPLVLQSKGFTQIIHCAATAEELLSHRDELQERGVTIVQLPQRRNPAPAPEPAPDPDAGRRSEALAMVAETFAPCETSGALEVVAISNVLAEMDDECN